MLCTFMWNNLWYPCENLIHMGYPYDNMWYPYVDMWYPYDNCWYPYDYLWYPCDIDMNFVIQMIICDIHVISIWWYVISICANLILPPSNWLWPQSCNLWPTFQEYDLTSAQGEIHSKLIHYKRRPTIREPLPRPSSTPALMTNMVTITHIAAAWFEFGFFYNRFSK